MLKNYIKKCEKYSILISILMIILSIFLIVNPLKSIETFVICFSIILLINGVGNLISYFSIDSTERLYSFDLIMGLMTIISGTLILIYRTALIEFFPIVLGIWIIANNLFKIQIAINLSSIKGSNWLWLLLMSIIMIGLGILLIVKPFSSTIAITSVAGIFLLITEIINLIDSIIVLTKMKKFD